MSAFDTLDDLAAWLDARSELIADWLSCCEFAPEDTSSTEPALARVRLVQIDCRGFAGSLFGADGGQSSGGGSSGLREPAAA